ncbi:MAG: hypothetical protein JNM22_12965 [Saprospiraceae bacterium]|nr:hypothetical protein [Saprospiraceae bacterium]
MDKQPLLELLAANRLSELFEALKNEPSYHTDLILLESKWNELRAKQRNDLVSHEQANLELGQIRNSLLQMIESGGSQRVPYAVPTPTKSAPNRIWIYVLAAVAGIFIFYGIYRFTAAPAAGDGPKVDKEQAPSARPASGNEAGSSQVLNVSEAGPITIAAGDEQYERVYSVVKTSVESVGGGKSLITLRIGLNFKGIINKLLSSENFRLTAPELPGPVAPSNYLSELVDSRSYGEGDIKFELSDDIKRFTITIEGKEDKKWNFSR